MSETTATDSCRTDHWNVIIIGAGVAGALAACLCARRGFRTLLMDRQAFPRHKVCGCCLNGRALAVLDRCGLSAALHAVSPMPVDSMRIHLRGRRVKIPMPRSVAVSRATFDQLLVDEAVGLGCQFRDRTTASVMPMTADEGSDGAWSWTANGVSAEVRCVELRPTAGTATELRSEDPATTAAIRATADLVLVCDGLGHSSLRHLSAVTSNIRRRSRIGLGAVMTNAAAHPDFPAHEIQMAVTRYGYAGIVELEQNQRNIAAAVDAEFLQAHDNAASALKTLLQDAGLSCPPGFDLAHVRGTLPLTRTTHPLALPRLLVLGDAAGYVEPFTGEGMAWALASAEAMMPLVERTVREGWYGDTANQWQSLFSQQVGGGQRFCRLLAGSLKSPWMLHPMMTACQLFPSVTRRIVARLNDDSGSFRAERKAI